MIHHSDLNKEALNKEAPFKQRSKQRGIILYVLFACYADDNLGNRDKTISYKIYNQEKNLVIHYSGSSAKPKTDAGSSKRTISDLVRYRKSKEDENN